jgi:hypothetical protein
MVGGEAGLDLGFTFASLKAGVGRLIFCSLVSEVLKKPTETTLPGGREFLAPSADCQDIPNRGRYLGLRVAMPFLLQEKDAKFRNWAREPKEPNPLEGCPRSGFLLASPKLRAIKATRSHPNRITLPSGG